MLVYYIYNALIAHRMAYKKAGILHRDVSMSNILINIDKTEAFLNDWDLCKYNSDEDLGSQDGRLGTWPFMSGVLSQCPHKPNGVEDDIESFIYVLEVSCLRFHRHVWTQKKHGGSAPDVIEPPEPLEQYPPASNPDIQQQPPQAFIRPKLTAPVDLDPSPLAYYYSYKFDVAVYFSPGETVGGASKTDHMLLGRPGDFRLADGSRLDALLRELYALGQTHYKQLDLAGQTEKWGPRSIASEPCATAGPEENQIYRTPTTLYHSDDDEQPPRKTQKLTSAGNRQPTQAAIARAAADTTSSPNGGFADHNAIMEIFGKYLAMDWKNILPTPDQFEGLNLLGVERTASVVGGSRARPSTQASSTQASSRASST
ncbi:hypothetical protein PsYK624_035040 [Phanerochaete sordida]|uniref:Fungal-type protein kinase domain-containing protein n=1 Tax=Phanerochaete sordida TaxID=48140 RepID=A0A9P3G391_9APHY|nr:hypothetical protein PsYK624_035040 [Phanerochaete sordida]